MARWSRGTFEVPDVVGYEDYVHSARAFADDLASELPRHEPEPIATFPYPNPPKTTPRPLTLAGIRDLVLLRAAAGRVVICTDAILSASVRSCRLDSSQPGPWRFQDFGPAHATLRQDAVAHLRRTSDAMCRTDVAGYYSSINLGVLAEALLSCGCDAAAVGFLMRVIGLWQARHGLRGLPIGPEPCGVLGNALLKPVDDAIRSVRRTHLRWIDDMFIFGPTIADCEGVVEPVDEALTALGLARAVPKTNLYGNGDAIGAMQDGVLASLEHDVRFYKALAKELLHDAFDCYIRGRDDFDVRRFRWIINTMKNRLDPYAVVALAEDASAMNKDPRCAGSYIAKVGIGKPRVVESIMSKLGQKPDDTTDALDVHLLRAMSSKPPRGRAEGKVFEAIAEDDERRAPVRAWAWQALGSTPLWKERRAMEAADDERAPDVRRAIVVTLRGRSGRSIAKFLSRVSAPGDAMTRAGNSDAGTRRTGPVVRMTARSIAFASSRAFPGHA